MSKSQKIYMLTAIFFLMLADILGAYGTHVLQTMLSEHAITVFKTGVQYQFYHALALLILSLLMFHIQNTWIVVSGISFIVGIFLFSGSLYGLSVISLKFGFITPLGGLAFILGWIFLGIGVIKTKSVAL